MVNAVTGDFEAVVQVSGLTINRLLATMSDFGVLLRSSENKLQY